METKFKTYTGTKTIKAMPMKKSDAEFRIGRVISPATTEEEGYLVQYEDGYQSWSPKEAFEKAYKVSETYVDRMIIELDDLTDRILKATKAALSYGYYQITDRDLLCKQITEMRDYAEILYTRIQKSYSERFNLQKEESKE